MPHLQAGVTWALYVRVVTSPRAATRDRGAVSWDRLVATLRERFLTTEVLTFLTVGGAGYVVDVLAFNLLRSTPPFSVWDPSVARTVAVVAAMCVTYAGNRLLTWRDRTSRSRRREVVLFAVANLIGYLFSVGCLLVSHDLMGFTSRLADNISANVVGLVLGTAFRFVAYKYVVFAGGPEPRLAMQESLPD